MHVSRQRGARIRTIARDNTSSPEFHDEFQRVLVTEAAAGLDGSDNNLDHAEPLQSTRGSFMPQMYRT